MQRPWPPRKLVLGGPKRGAEGGAKEGAGGFERLGRLRATRNDWRASSNRLGGVLRRLEASQNVLRRLGSGLKASWRRLGASWRCLGWSSSRCRRVLECPADFSSELEPSGKRPGGFFGHPWTFFWSLENVLGARSH